MLGKGKGKGEGEGGEKATQERKEERKKKGRGKYLKLVVIRKIMERGHNIFNVHTFAWLSAVAVFSPRRGNEKRERRRGKGRVEEMKDE